MGLGSSSPSRMLVSEATLSRASTRGPSRWEFGLGRRGSRRFRLGLDPLTA
jgi:hypothetical protein